LQLPPQPLQLSAVNPSTGSIVGATIGGLAVAYAPVAFLKVMLGCVLLAAAVKTVTHKA
jgi:uncharacterized membrane protein YfcA